jgi:type 1 glutamine amidotransferase
MSECPDGPNEMMWTREFGRGRIFYNSLGHDLATWQNETWQRLVIQGIQWAAGRK